MQPGQVRGGGLLVAGGDGAAFLQARPAVLDPMAPAVGPLVVAHLRVRRMRRDHRHAAALADQGAPGRRRIATVAHHLAEPAIVHGGQQLGGDGQLVALTRLEREGERPAEPVADDADLGAEAASGAAERLELERVPFGNRPTPPLIRRRRRPPSGGRG